MAKWKGLASLVSQLQAKRTNLVAQIRHMDATLSVLGKLDDERLTRKPQRKLSIVARRKISAAQKARWAKRTANAKAGAKKPKRVLSAAARKKIADAQRQRWKLWKASHKKAA